MNTYAHLYTEKQKTSAKLIGKALEIEGNGVKLESLENFSQNKNANLGVLTGTLPDNIPNGATDGT
jgi:hypothetical protein